MKKSKDIVWEEFYGEGDESRGLLTSEALLPEGLRLRAALEKTRVEWDESGLVNGPTSKTRRWVHNYTHDDIDATWPEVDSVRIIEKEFEDTIVLSVEHRSAMDSLGDFNIDTMVWGTRARPSPIRRITPGKIVDGKADYYEPVVAAIAYSDGDDLDEYIGEIEGLVHDEMKRIGAASQNKKLVRLYEDLQAGKRSADETNLYFLGIIRAKYQLTMEQLERVLELCEERVAQNK